MENTFEGMVPETELQELTEVNETENGAGGEIGKTITKIATATICPTSACTPRCGK